MRVLIDDVRSFSDGRDCIVCRTSDDAILTLEHLRDAGARVNELWLDFDLGGGHDIRPVLEVLESWSIEQRPLPVDKVLIHTSSDAGAALIKQACDRLAYPSVRIERGTMFASS